MEPYGEYSILRGWDARPLAIVLARRLADPTPDGAYRALLERLYGALSPDQRAQCRAEVARQAETLRRGAWAAAMLPDHERTARL